MLRSVADRSRTGLVDGPAESEEPFYYQNKETAAGWCKENTQPVFRAPGQISAASLRSGDCDIVSRDMSLLASPESHYAVSSSVVR